MRRAWAAKHGRESGDPDGGPHSSTARVVPEHRTQVSSSTPDSAYVLSHSRWLTNFIDKMTDSRKRSFPSRSPGVHSRV